MTFIFSHFFNSQINEIVLARNYYLRVKINDCLIITK